MKPISHIYNIDCMDKEKGLPSYPDNHFDLAIVDPPYFKGPNKRGFYGKRVSTHGVKRIDYPKTENWNVPGSEYFDELTRVSKHQIVWGCNYFNYLFPHGRIVWDKVNLGSSFSDAEIASCSIFDSVRLFPFMWNGMMQGKSIKEGRKMQGRKYMNEKKIHVTQKPIALYAWLLNNYAKPGNTILDTHLGSGSSRIAAYKLGFDFTGYEIEKAYFDAQEERFQRECKGVIKTKSNQTIIQVSLFD